MRVATWNLNVRRNVAAQAAAIAASGVDVVALQEVSCRGTERLADALAEIGLEHFRVPSPAPAFQFDRCVAIASRWPLGHCEQASVPAAESALAVEVEVPGHSFEFVGVHIPTIARGQPLKLATQEGVAARLRTAAERPTVFCGDLNSPIAETADGEVVPFSRKSDLRAFAAELSILTGLGDHGMVDAYRAANGPTAADLSWWWKNRGKTGGFRLDHVFVSRHFRVAACWYDHSVREDRLSDHSLMVAEIELVQDSPGVQRDG